MGPAVRNRQEQSLARVLVSSSRPLSIWTVGTLSPFETPSLRLMIHARCVPQVRTHRPLPSLLVTNERRKRPAKVCTPLAKIRKRLHIGAEPAQSSEEGATQSKSLAHPSVVTGSMRNRMRPRGIGPLRGACDEGSERQSGDSSRWASGMEQSWRSRDRGARVLGEPPSPVFL